MHIPRPIPFIFVAIFGIVPSLLCVVLLLMFLLNLEVYAGPPHMFALMIITLIGGISLSFTVFTYLYMTWLAKIVRFKRLRALLRLREREGDGRQGYGLIGEDKRHISVIGANPDYTVTTVKPGTDQKQELHISEESLWWQFAPSLNPVIMTGLDEKYYANELRYLIRELKRFSY